MKSKLLKKYEIQKTTLFYKNKVNFQKVLYITHI